MHNCHAVDIGSILTSTEELLDSEQAFVSAMHRLWFGRFECLRITNGELQLDPWPATVRDFKFGSDQVGPVELRTKEFELKRQVQEFIQLVRSIESGEVRRLEIRHGLPFSMELERGLVEQKPIGSSL